MTEVPRTDNPVDDLAEEFARRWRNGEQPSIEEYAARFPQWAAEIRDVFPAVLMMEEFKPRLEDNTSGKGPAAYAIPAPERLGDYHILREIGRGGMGVVYEAQHEALGRWVAIKVLAAHLMGNDQSRARFRRESQAAARLHHTNIVPVFDVGEQGGLCYHVMQLIRGRSIDAIVWPTNSGTDDGTASPFTPRAIAQIGAQVADALAYAHAQGVLHRDIKPSNLLLDETGAVWVTDFGVAKLVEDANLTRPGDLVGTLRYMPPERFFGQTDARGDVYSLGITLYEILTRQPAFPETGQEHLIQRIGRGDLTPPRAVDPTVPIDLETIILKAVAPDPTHRYQTAGELADDLRRFLDDRPILARRVRPTEQVWRWCRRNPALAAVTATTLLLMMAITVVSVVAWVKTAAANHAAAAANQEMEGALAAEKAQREHAETTANLALEALNRTYERFAPTRLVVTPQTATGDGVELPPQPALTPEVARLLEDLLRTYDQIARSAEEFPALHAQAAEANQRIADIRLRLGRFEDAAAAYRTAIDLYTPLPTDAAGEAVRIKLARACNELGRTLRLLQQYDEAARMHERAIRTLTEAPEAFTALPECRYELARSCYWLGHRDTLLSPRGYGLDRPPGGPGRGPPPPPPPPRPNGEHPARRAIALLDALMHEFPKVPEYRHLLACCYRDMPPPPPPAAGGGPPPPNPNVERAIGLLEDLVNDRPEVPDYCFDLCETLARTRSPSRTSERLEEAVRLSAELVKHYPSVPEYVAARARYLTLLGNARARAGKLAEAEKLQLDALVLLRKLVKHYPDVIVYQYLLSCAECALGRVLSEAGRLEEARARIESAAGRVEALQKNPRLVALRNFLRMAYQELSQVLAYSGELELSANAFLKSETFRPEAGTGFFGMPPPQDAALRPH
jgi:tetratricopeptide (TPR) repeat protein